MLINNYINNTKESFSMFVTIFLFLTFDTVLTKNFLNTTSGVYIGRTVNYNNITVKQYLGIEYGRIKKRFERAEIIQRENNTIINATTFGAICKPTMNSCIFNNETTICSINYGIFTIKSSPSEQCLFLNVFIPNINNDEYQNRKKAIFMWIHGGSAQIGTGNLFDGTILAALGNLIVVTFNFRLNLFGFLSSGDTRLEGNLGLYDQSMVLDWIYDNIDALGGDRERITVGGHSAGAPHAYYLAKSPFNRGRIRRLILQSGCPYNIWSHIKANQALERFDIIADNNQCGMMKTFEEKLQCLQEKDYQLLGEYEHNAYSSANHTNVVINGDYIKGFNGDSLDSNNTLGDIDILMGSNDDEGKINIGLY